MAEAYPAALPQRPLRQGYRLQPIIAPERDEMETGALLRRLWPTVPWRVDLAWPFRQVELPVFRAWWHHRLADGAEWFTLSLFSGAVYETVTARPIGRYRAAPRNRVKWSLSLALEVQSFAPLDPAVKAALTSDWPAALPPAPRAESYGLDPHEELLRDGESGPTAVRQRFTATPGAITVRWRMSFAQFALFRGWWSEVLLSGARWARIPLWLDGALIPLLARFNGAWRAELGRGFTWEVAAQLDTKPLPMLAAGDLDAILD